VGPLHLSAHSANARCICAPLNIAPVPCCALWQDLLDEFTYFLPDNNGPLPANMRGASMRMGMAGRGRGGKAAGGMGAGWVFSGGRGCA